MPSIMLRADVVIALRDKGFLWWPTAEACAQVVDSLPRGTRVVALGTAIEALPTVQDFQTSAHAGVALALSYDADLFIGTDTDGDDPGARGPEEHLLH